MPAIKEATSRKTWRIYQSNIEPKLYNKTKQKQVSAKGQCVGFSRRKMILKMIFGKAEIPVVTGSGVRNHQTNHIPLEGCQVRNSRSIGLRCISAICLVVPSSLYMKGISSVYTDLEGGM